LQEKVTRRHSLVSNYIDSILNDLIIEPRPDILIPVPLHSRRLRQRGYKQSLELAKRIGKRTGIPLD